MSNLVKFAGNDYLGLAGHPDVIAALADGARRYGISATSSRMAVGWTEAHANLETHLADFMGTDAALIIGATYIAGAVVYGVLADMLGRPVVYLDETAHTTHKLGTRAYGLEVRTFRHLDPDDLARQLERHEGPPPIIASDGVFSISGEVAPLDRLGELARRYGATLLVDEAHGVGTLGATGRGAWELMGLDPAGVIVIASMSKAFGCGGGFIAGPREVIDRCRRSPDANASSLPPPPICAAADKALEMIRTQPQHRRRMEANARVMRDVLAENGVGVVDDRHPIVAMLFADESEAAAMANRFREFGLWLPYFKYPSEPRHNMLRGAARAVYTPEDLEKFAQAVRTRPAGRK
ncbi:MAG: 8-amino-7-oxononanoate synthase [Phycisphaerae bacterium]|nr:8-amino-7-oxononanoate synthase [Phycisphaerae bacterium]